MIDLHVHTTCSDGKYTPCQVIQKAKENNVQILAITDHNTTKGYEEAKEEARKLRIKLIPGIELEAKLTYYVTDTRQDRIYQAQEIVHILGYGVNGIEKDPRLQKIEKSRINQIELFRKYLYKNRKSVSIEELEKINHNYQMQDLVKLLIEKNYYDKPKEVYSELKKLGYKRKVLNAKEAIKIIKEYGGIPIEAHFAQNYLHYPKSIKMLRLSEKVAKMKELGIMGIEAVHSSNKPGEKEEYIKMANKFKLIYTSGSDFHGRDREQIKIGRGFNGNTTASQYETYKIMQGMNNAKRKILENNQIMQQKEMEYAR